MSDKSVVIDVLDSDLAYEDAADGFREFQTELLAWLDLARDAEPSKDDEEIQVGESITSPAAVDNQLLEIEQPEITDTLPSLNNLVGQVLFGRYSVFDIIGKGEVSTVYAATDLKVDRIVAIKQLPALTLEIAMPFNKAVEEYKSLQHPNLIQLLDCRPLDDTPCLILEYAQGETLRKLLSRTNFIETEAQIGRTALQICSLLSHLHSKGFAHGNLTTGSIILVEANGETIVKVGGFCSIEASNGSSDDNENINQVNIKDTFERLTATTNKSTRIRSDVNAVAAIIYEMITGFNLNEEEHRDDQELVAISALRPDIAEVEFLKETLKKGLSKKDGYKSIVHFQNAIRSWMEKVNREFAAAAASGSTQFVKPRTDVLEKVSLIEARRSETYVPVSKRWKRQYQGLKFIEADLRSELNSLKANQIKSEATLSMLVSKAIAAKRQRKSPVRAIAEIAIASTCVVVTCGAVVNYFSTNLDSMKSKYLGVARALSRPAASTSVEAEPQIELLDYRQDSAYKRWSNSKEFGQARRIEANCQLRDK